MGAGGRAEGDLASFAETFAPDRDRPALKRSEYVWLGGLGLAVAAILLLAFAWFAYQQALPSTGPLAMRPSPGLSVEELRALNREAAPWVAVTSLPLLLSGLWLLVRRPNNRDARRVAIVGTVLFAVGMMAASSTVEGRVGIGY
jgi:hypothetical protein